MTKRRDFIAGFGTLTAGLVLAPGALLANMTPHQLPRQLQAVSDRDSFTSLLNSSFKLDDGTGAGTRQAKLVEIQDLPSSARHQQFSLVFESGDAVYIPAGSYLADSPDADPFLIYLQPISPVAGSRHFVADFSLLRV